MQSSTSPNERYTVMHRLIDKIMPNNCRAQVKAAASENREVVDEAICLLKTYREKIKEKIHHAA